MKREKTNYKFFKMCETNFSEIYYIKNNNKESIIKVFSPKNTILCCDKFKNKKLYDKRKEILKKQFKKEYQILKILENIKEVVNVEKYIETSNFNVIVEEYCQGETLKKWKINQLNYMGNDEIYTKLNIFKKILCVVQKIHEKDIIHSDLSVNNIIVNDKNELKIIDFNNSLYINDTNIDYFVNNVVNESNKKMFLENKKKFDIYNLSKILKFLFIDYTNDTLKTKFIKDINKIIENGISLDKKGFLYNVNDMYEEIEKLKKDF